MICEGNEGSVVVLPGTFDPMTNGHLDLIQRTAAMFDVLVIGVGHNPEKTPLFSAAERVDIIERLTSDLPNVRVEAYDGLTFDFAKRIGAGAIVKGVRDTTDLRHELEQANVNRIVGNVETILVPTSDQLALISSTVIRHIAMLGGNLDSLTRIVPPLVARLLKEKLVDGDYDGPE